MRSGDAPDPAGDEAAVLRLYIRRQLAARRDGVAHIATPIRMLMRVLLARQSLGKAREAAEHSPLGKCSALETRRLDRPS
jgi:hypothetical protein